MWILTLDHYTEKFLQALAANTVAKNIKEHKKMRVKYFFL
jgi:hypothetical protein